MADNIIIQKQTRILLADDSQTTRMIAQKTLENLGYKNIETRADGEWAWARIKINDPPLGLAIMDWHMPKLTGLQVLEKIRAEGPNKDLPVIMITAERNREEVAKILKLRVLGYLVKPFDSEHLKKLVEKIP